MNGHVSLLPGKILFLGSVACFTFAEALVTSAELFS